MKKALILILLIMMLVSPAVALAATPTPRPKSTSQAVNSNTPADQDVADVSQETDYVLPYPGLLPDHPLYIIKQIRDYILEFLIVDPIKKDEFYLLQADKKLNMGLFLMERGKSTMAADIIGEAEQHMDRAVGWLASIKQRGIDVPRHLVERLEDALIKHEVTIDELIKKQPDETVKTTLTGLLDVVKKLQSELGKQMSPGANL